jgi:alpha-ketoglutarate-dependent taurine dioxygenase
MTTTPTMTTPTVLGRPPVVHTQPGTGGALAWLRDQQEQLATLVDRHGAVLVRGLGVRDRGTAAEVGRVLLGEPTVEREAFAPRTPYPGGLYSATEWPADQPMCMHHELSYAREVPTRQVFCCLTAPVSGGATALADAAAVLRDLPDELVARFERAGWELIRNHNDLIGIGWAEAFGTPDRAAVEDYLRAGGVRWEWTADGGLRTHRVRPAVIRHPVSGERLWFNQIAFLNEWTMDPTVREYLVLEFGADALPFTTRCGDGTPLDRATVDLINDVYARHTVREPWRDGDVLVVDNLRMAHSREPYEGEREVVVAFGAPVSVEASVSVDAPVSVEASGSVEGQ